MHLQKDSMMRQSMEEMGIFDAQALYRHGFSRDTRHVLNSSLVARVLQVGVLAHPSTVFATFRKAFFGYVRIMNSSMKGHRDFLDIFVEEFDIRANSKFAETGNDSGFGGLGNPVFTKLGRFCLLDRIVACSQAASRL